jgi:putative chitinase
MITIASLIASGIAPTQARVFVEPLKAACALFGIDRPSRLAGFLAQCRVESAGFTQLEEGLYYRDPERIMKIFKSRVHSLEQAQRLAKNPKLLANVVYADRMENGPPTSGDGWAYRGRGLIQLTGRANYRVATACLSRPYLDQPDLVATPEDACLTAAWYWQANSLNELADVGLWDEITRTVNRGMLHAAERRQYSQEALTAFV